MTCAQLRTKTRTSISRRNIFCVKSGFPILYAVEQLSSIFSKDKLKQGAHIHQTDDPPSPRMSWENCRAVPSQQLSHMLCGAGTRLGRKGSFVRGFSPVTGRQLCHADDPQWGRNSCPWLPLPAWYGCRHAWGNGQAVGWYMCAPCFNLLVTRDLPSPRMSW